MAAPANGATSVAPLSELPLPVLRAEKDALVRLEAARGQGRPTLRNEYERLAVAGLCNGIFPLITNETAMSDLELLLS